MNSRLFWLAVCVLALHQITVKVAASDNWPQFRGPQASGVSSGPAAPTKWDAVSRENILWQTVLPGLGHASPIVWENKIYIATATRPGAKPKLKIGLYGDGDSYKEKEKHQWRLLCLDKATGKILWDRLEWEAVPPIAIPRRPPTASVS